MRLGGTGRSVLSDQTQTLRRHNCTPTDWSSEENEVTDYCLGVIVVRNAKTGEPVCYWHNGSVFGAEAWLGYFPQTQASLVILLNGRDESGPGNLANEMAGSIETALPQLFRNATP